MARLKVTALSAPPECGPPRGDAHRSTHAVQDRTVGAASGGPGSQVWRSVNWRCASGARAPWCPERDSNPYGLLEPADFKSAASTGFAIRAACRLCGRSRAPGTGMKKGEAWKASPCFGSGAGNETRTRDPNLGKVVLYQLSHIRMSCFQDLATLTEKLATRKLLGS